jgi:hypothetical protein
VLQSADRALAAFREAEVQRKDGDLDSADATVDQALLVLQERYINSTLICSVINHSLLPLSIGALPTLYKSMTLRLGRHEITPLLAAAFVPKNLHP